MSRIVESPKDRAVFACTAFFCACGRQQLADCFGSGCCSIHIVRPVSWFAQAPSPSHRRRGILPRALNLLGWTKVFVYVCVCLCGIQLEQWIVLEVGSGQLISVNLRPKKFVFLKGRTPFKQPAGFLPVEFAIAVGLDELVPVTLGALRQKWHPLQHFFATFLCVRYQGAERGASILSEGIKSGSGQHTGQIMHSNLRQLVCLYIRIYFWTVWCCRLVFSYYLC